MYDKIIADIETIPAVSEWGKKEKELEYGMRRRCLRQNSTESADGSGGV